MEISVIFLVFTLMSLGTYANPIQPNSEIDSNIQDSRVKARRELPLENPEPHESELSLGLKASAAESSYRPRQHTRQKRGFWSSVGRGFSNIGRGAGKAARGAWRGFKAVATPVLQAAAYNTWGRYQRPFQQPYQQLNQGSPQMQPQMSPGMSPEMSSDESQNSEGDYNYQ